jgi:ribosome-associated protein
MTEAAGLNETQTDDTLEIVGSVAALLGEKKAENILVLDISSLTHITDYFIIADVGSQMQIDSLRSHIVDTLSARKIFARNAVNQMQTSWALLDYNGFVVHLFLSEVREFYGLERIWREGKFITF